MPSDLQRSAERSRRAGEKIVQGLQDAFAAQPGAKGGRAPSPAAPRAQRPARYERDFQTTRVYDAQRAIRRVLDAQPEHPFVMVAGSTLTVPLERRFADIDSIQAYCTDALNRSWPAYEQAVRSGVRVRPRRGAQKAHYEQGGVIAIPMGRDGMWAQTQFVVCHEIAHHLVGAGHGHDSDWVRAFLFILEQEMGPEMGLLTRWNFAEGGVKM